MMFNFCVLFADSFGKLDCGLTCIFVLDMDGMAWNSLCRMPTLAWPSPIPATTAEVYNNQFSRMDGYRKWNENATM